MNSGEDGESSDEILELINKVSTGDPLFLQKSLDVGKHFLSSYLFSVVIQWSDFIVLRMLKSIFERNVLHCEAYLLQLIVRNAC